MNESKHAMPDTWRDPDDAPELDDAFFEHADRFDGQRLIRRGRPPAEVRKVALSGKTEAPDDAIARRLRAIERKLAAMPDREEARRLADELFARALRK
jgi:hypothetical protein